MKHERPTSFTIIDVFCCRYICLQRVFSQTFDLRCSCEYFFLHTLYERTIFSYLAIQTVRWAIQLNLISTHETVTTKWCTHHIINWKHTPEDAHTTHALIHSRAKFYKSQQINSFGPKLNRIHINRLNDSHNEQSI